MKEWLKKISRIALAMVIWVFVLSINVSGKPLFYHANDVLVQNDIVRAIDEEVSGFWTKFKMTAKATLFNKSDDKREEEI